MNPLFDAISQSPKTYDELLGIFGYQAYVDGLLLPLIKTHKVIGIPDAGTVRFVPLKHDPETRTCRTCKQDFLLSAFVHHSGACTGCREKRETAKAIRKKRLNELFKKGKKECATCGAMDFLYRFQPMKSGNRSKDCYACRMKRVNKRTRPIPSGMEPVTSTT